jgi:hypothetical protein
MNTNTIIESLRRIECALSPENLHCDGEITRKQAEAKRRKLVKERDRLVAELGREPTDDELWGRH